VAAPKSAWDVGTRSAGRPCRHDDCLLTEDDDADAADTYDSDTDAAAYGGDEL